MNRWRQRLAELRGDGAEPPTALPRSVQSVHNVQNPASAPPFERFERFEQPAKPPLAPPSAIERAAVTWGEAEAERAGIVEYDSAVPREWAEGFARLDPDRPPADVPLRRWQRFVDDVGLFLDGPFCAVAAALGWGPYDLFGCDRDRPFARIDLCGLLWLLNGHRLVMLAAGAASIETAAGARQVWRRKTTAPGRLLAWELVA